MRNDTFLSELKVGEVGKIVELTTTDRKNIGKMMSLGIIPGVSVCLLRRYPAFIVQIGYTKVALDHKLAVFIRVLPQP
ncbi:MAG TPA: FeoA family protein [Oscillospiraceae bacterium]|nr:FeoA family protein [Oscillospiraceae bacterium]